MNVGRNYIVDEREVTVPLRNGKEEKGKMVSVQNSNSPRKTSWKYQRFQKHPFHENVPD
jgi:hypothetical protein